ncbi:ABC transporter permease [Lagierella sp.]|uniref:ABC transporter permease n=1 Tax=Lagierella sp. TaxID=2849657 RepID=UPI002603DB89|nr:ABC transporter permease [Lagierella sp.]
MSTFIKKLKQSPIQVKLSLGILIVFILGAILADLYPKNGIDTDIANALVNPNKENLFGTDDLGRDYFARALHGARASLTVGFLSVVISTILGSLVGIIAGYFGGKVDMILMRGVDILMSIPSFFLILILNAALKPGIQNIIIIIGLFSWMGIARLVRAETLSLKERDYVTYAKLIGVSHRKIMVKHILRNITPTLTVAATVNVASAILTESSLSFLGLGVRQPNSSWGSMLKDAQQYLATSPYLAIFPGLLILLTVLAFNVIGDYYRKEI